MFLVNRKKAQTVAEYAILIGLVIAAITGVQFFVKTGIQRHIKVGVDHLSSAMVNLGVPANKLDMTGISAETITNQDIDEREELLLGGGVNRTTDGIVDSNRNEVINW